MEVNLTTKQIAEAVGKPERTVRDWVKALSAKSAEVSAKIAKARATSIAADYTLDEACQIIEEGMGADVANTYRTNAATAEMFRTFKPRYSAAFIREYRLAYGVEAAKGLLAELGFSPAPAPSNIIALPDPGEASYRALCELVGDKGARTIMAVTHKVAKLHVSEIEADKGQGKLFGGRE